MKGISLCKTQELMKLENILLLPPHIKAFWVGMKKWNENRYENEHMSNDIVLIPFLPFKLLAFYV